MKFIIQYILPFYGKFRKIAFVLPVVLGFVILMGSAFLDVPQKVNEEKAVAIKEVEHEKKNQQISEETEQPTSVSKKELTAVYTASRPRSVASAPKPEIVKEVVLRTELPVEETKEAIEVYTAIPIEKSTTPATIRTTKSAPVRVIGKQTVSTKHATLVVELLKEVVLNNVVIPKGSTLTAMANFEDAKVRFTVNRVVVEQQRFETHMKIIHPNGQEAMALGKKHKLKLNNDMMILEIQ